MFDYIKNLYKGILLIVIIAAILLFSNLNNRNKQKKENRFSDIKHKTEFFAAPGKTYKIGIVYFAPDISLDILFKGLFTGLKEIGFVKDSNLQIIFSHTNGEISNIQPVLQNMDNKDVDLIMTMTTPCLTGACAAIKNKNVVFTYCYDPIAAGACKSYTDHLPNITGVCSFPAIEQTINFIEKLLPGIKSVGTIYNSSEANSRKVMSVARELFKQKGIKLKEITVTNANEVFQAAQVITSRNIQALWITGDNTSLQAFEGILKNSDRSKIPLIVNDIEFVEKGATAAIGIGWYHTGYKTAPMVARVLLGENTENIPIENIVEENIEINIEKTEKLGIKVPDDIFNFVNTNSEKLKLTKKLNLTLIQYNDSPISEQSHKGIIDALVSLGLQPEIDFELTVRNAQADISTLNLIVDATITENYDLVFVTSTPTLQTVAKKIKNTPVVFSVVADPIIAGAGKSFTEHLPNFTGISTLGDFEGMIKLLKQILPDAKTIGTLFTPGEINSVNNKDELEKYANQYGLKLIVVPVNSSSEVTDATKSLISNDLDAICQIIDNLTSSSYPTILKISKKTNIPFFGFVSKQANDGAIAVVARDYYQAGVDAVNLANKIFKGENPKDIPFEFVSKTNVIINLDAAKFYGINISGNVIKSADKILY